MRFIEINKLNNANKLIFKGTFNKISLKLIIHHCLYLILNGWIFKTSAIS